MSRLTGASLSLSLFLVLSFVVALAPSAFASGAIYAPFIAQDGTDLDGFGSAGSGTPGDFFTSGWSAGANTPAGTFTVDNGQAVVGNTGGQSVSIARDFDVSSVNFGCPDFDPTCSTTGGVASPGRTFFYTQLTQIEDNHAAYDFGLNFSDVFGVTAGVGVINDGAGDPLGLLGHNDYFYADLGTTRVISSIAAAPNTPYYLYGALDFDAVNGSEERLQIWINSSVSDFYNGINPDIDVSFDLDAVPGASGRSSIGSTLTLTANTLEDGNSKAFDDILLGNDLELIGVPRIDLGNSSTVQSAFESWDAGATAVASITTSYDLQTYGPSFASQTVTLGLQSEGAGDLTPFNETFAVSGYADDLRRDGVASDDGFVLTFSNLNEDGHAVKTFHYNPDSAGAVDVHRSYDGGVSWDYFTTFVQATGGEAGHELMLLFDTLSTTDVSFRFTPVTPGGGVAINGIQFVPEPGTALLLGVGLAGLSVRRQD